MSIKAMAWAFEKEVSAEVWVIFLTLAHEADDTGLVVFSREYLSHLTDEPPGRVEAALTELRGKGLATTTSVQDSTAGEDARFDQALRLQLGSSAHEKAVPPEFLDEINADRARRRAQIGGIQ